MEGVLPTGYSMSFAGQSEDEEEAKAFLSKAFLYGVLMVLGLMVAKFDSLAIPFIIISSVIMSMVGVLLGQVGRGPADVVVAVVSIVDRTTRTQGVSRGACRWSFQRTRGFGPRGRRLRCVRRSAPVGHTGTQGGSSQCRQDLGKCTVWVCGKLPTSKDCTRLKKVPVGSAA